MNKIKSFARRLVKSLTGIDGLSLYVKKQKKKVLKIVYRKKYTAKELVERMKEMGMKQGSTVFIHSSMTEFFNFIGTGTELVDEIIAEIGEEGTLIMPAYPKDKSKLMNNKGDEQGVDFDVVNTPSGAGYLSEVFRKYPGVKRSINLQHSVCAYGKHSEFLTYEHHLSLTAWDERSPYYKMSQMDTLVFAFGLPYFLGTMIHCTESLLYRKYKYFALFFTKEMVYSYIDQDGNIGAHTQLTHSLKRVRSKKRVIKKYFNKKRFHVKYLSNLRIEMVEAKYTLDLFLNLAENGKTMYSLPDPKPYLKKGKFIGIDE